MLFLAYFNVSSASNSLLIPIGGVHGFLGGAVRASGDPETGKTRLVVCDPLFNFLFYCASSDCLNKWQPSHTFFNSPTNFVLGLV